MGLYDAMIPTILEAVTKLEPKVTELQKDFDSLKETNTKREADFEKMEDKMQSLAETFAEIKGLLSGKDNVSFNLTADSVNQVDASSTTNQTIKQDGKET